MRERMISLVCLLLMVAAGAHAASHWTVNPHAYQYDMTVYVQLSTSVQTGYEVAAFCGDECRGVGVLLTAGDGTQVFQLRVRSNESVGEKISFRVYQAAADREYFPTATVDFASQAVVGTPSEPLLLAIAAILQGDVNGDGVVNIADVAAVLNIMAGNSTGNGDVNGDGVVNIADVAAVLNIMAGN